MALISKHDGYTHKRTLNKTLSKPARVVILGWFFAGFSMVAGYAFPDLDVNPSIVQSQEMEIILGFLLMTGSILASLSTIYWKNESTSWRLELVSLPILVGAWLMYVLLVMFTSLERLFPISIGLSFAIACIMRFYEVNKKIDKTRHNVEILKRGEDA